MPPATSSQRSGKRPSNWKVLRRTAKLCRVAPVFVPRNSSSLSESIQCRASSSGCQSCFMGRFLADSIPAPSQNWAERLHDQTATAKLVEKGTKRQAWFRLLCRNFDLRYLRAYNAAVTAFAKRGRPPADVPHDSVRSSSRGTKWRMALEGRQASKPCQRQCLRSAHKPWIPRILNE
jgi:hypothetical protein